MDYFNEHFTEILWALVFAVVSAFLVELFLHPFKKFKEKKKNTKAHFTYFGKSTGLTPQIVMGLTRPYNPYYFKRDFDPLFESHLKGHRNLLITGPPLAGKSRAVYQMLTSIKNPVNVAVPRFVDIHPESFSFPKGTDIVFVDDLQRFVERPNFDFIFKKALEQNITIISTCHSDLEYEKVKNRFNDSNLPLGSVFSSKDIISVPFISEETGKEIAERVNLKLDKKGFNKTIGSIFMNLTEMEKRFAECSVEEKTVLRMLKDLYTCGVYEGNLEFSFDTIKTAANSVGLEGKDYLWSAWFESLKKRQFVIIKANSVLVEQCYLESIIKPSAERSDLEIFGQMISAFSGSPAELLLIGAKAYDIGRLTLEWLDYTKTALKAFDAALKIYTLGSSPLKYAETQNNLALAYNSLSEIEDRSGNCRRSFDACKEALKVYTADKFPQQFAMIQNNLSGAYIRLAEYENRLENCRNSIKAGEQALKASSPVQYPLQYAGAKFSLGIAYRMIAELEDRAGNCATAVKECEEALIIFNADKFPVKYSTMQNVIGLAYTTLALTQDKADNCNKAILAFEKALEACPFDEYPNNYATTQNNLGTGYSTLADVEDRKLNCKKAIDAFEEVLKIRTFEKFPLQYAMAQCNLGHVYGKLAEIDDTAQNCRTSIKACGESLRIYTPEQFPILFATTQNILAGAYEQLSAVEDKKVNLNLSIQANERALKIYDLQQYPVQYASTLSSLGDVYSKLAMIENKEEYCRKGIDAYETVLSIFTEKDFPDEYKPVNEKLNRLKDFCKKN